MKRLSVTFILLGLFFQWSYGQTKKGTKLPSGNQIIENFEDNEEGTLPRGWYDQKGEQLVMSFPREKREKYKYNIIKEEGNHFLRYEGRQAMHINFPLINKNKENIYDINLYKTPILSWKVRAHMLPKNAREDNDDINDSVASIYVAFDMGRVALFKKVPKTIRYSWSSSLEEGTELSKFFGNQKVVIIESGPEQAGKWVTFKRNIAKDYERLFGEKPPKYPLAILILSDGDSTGSWVKADYDDIMLKTEK